MVLVDFCASRPGAVMSRRWGETLFTVRHRVFAFVAAPASVTVKVERARRRAALAHPSVRRARYVGIFGWLTITVVDPQSMQVALALIDASHQFAMRRR